LTHDWTEPIVCVQCAGNADPLTHGWTEPIVCVQCAGNADSLTYTLCSSTSAVI